MHKHFVRYLFFILQKSSLLRPYFSITERNMLKSSNLLNNCAYFSILFFQNQPPECNTPADLGKFHIFFIFSDICYWHSLDSCPKTKLKQSLKYLKTHAENIMYILIDRTLPVKIDLMSFSDIINQLIQ